MTPAQQEIADAARLVPEYVGWHGRLQEWHTARAGRPWQPTADTEAGRSDWAVLDTAVEKWLEDNCKTLYGPDADAGKYAEIISKVCGMDSAKSSGDLAQRQAATFAAAAAIGKHLRGGE